MSLSVFIPGIIINRIGKRPWVEGPIATLFKILSHGITFRCLTITLGVPLLISWLLLLYHSYDPSFAEAGNRFLSSLMASKAVELGRPRHVIVVGGGLAGLSASLEALERGARVTLLEKEAAVGGNSQKATSGINGAGTKFQATRNIQDAPELFR